MNNGARITYLRKLNGLTQKELAKKINRPITYISKLETGTVDIMRVSLKNGLMLCDALGCTIDDLVADIPIPIDVRSNAAKRMMQNDEELIEEFDEENVQ